MSMMIHLLAKEVWFGVAICWVTAIVTRVGCVFVGLAYQGKDIVFRFIIGGFGERGSKSDN